MVHGNHNKWKYKLVIHLRKDIDYYFVFFLNVMKKIKYIIIIVFILLLNIDFNSKSTVNFKKSKNSEIYPLSTIYYNDAETNNLETNYNLYSNPTLNNNLIFENSFIKRKLSSHKIFLKDFRSIKFLMSSQFL